MAKGDDPMEKRKGIEQTRSREHESFPSFRRKKIMYIYISLDGVLHQGMRHLQQGLGNLIR